MANLAKREKFKAMIKAAHEKHGGKIGDVGQGIIEYAGHTGLAIASNTMTSGFFGVDILRPDFIALLLSGAGYFLGGKKAHKTAKSAARASIHALITRLVIKSKTVLVHGSDGWSFKPA